jgi:hypothetical protein
MFAHVTLPCAPTLTGTDTPYIAFGAYTDTANNLIESGEQFIPNADPTKSAYQPYIRYGGSARISFPGDGTATSLYPIQAQSGSGDGSAWVCGANPSVTIYPEFFIEIVPTGSVPTGPTFGTLITNSSWLGDTYNGPAPNSIVYGVLLPNDDPLSSTAGWNGWSFVGDYFTGNLNCTNCHLTQTTAIGMDGPHPGDGSVFGPVQWSNMVVGDAAAGVYSTCANAPSWTNGGNECGNTPASPLNSVIQVSNQSLTTMGTDTVTINNAAPGEAELVERLQTTQFPSDAPSYVFADAAAAGGPDVRGSAAAMSSAVRAPQDMRRIACSGFIDVNVQANGTARNTVPAAYDILCPVRLGSPDPPAYVRDVHVTTHVYRFNDQATEIRQPQDNTFRCNYYTCTGSINVPVASESKIVEFETYYTAGGPGVEPESLHRHRRVPFNSNGFAYPEIVDTRYSGLPLAQPLSVPFPPGSPGGRTVQNCRKGHGVCVRRDGHFKPKLEEAYGTSRWPNADMSLVNKGNSVNGHHIQELQWGGDNTLDNGVLLWKPEHDEFTNWWGRVTGY